MSFGTPFAKKPRKAEPVRPFTAALVRIVALALLAAAASAYGIYLYYTHAFRAPPRRAPPAATSGEIEAPEIVPLPSPSATAD